MVLAIHGIRLDDPQRPAIIAELSGNHGQDYAQPERLVAAAAKGNLMPSRPFICPRPPRPHPDIIVVPRPPSAPKARGGQGYDL